jgi:hypothetical protein
VAHPGYTSPQFILYTLTLQVLPASIFQPAVPTTAALSTAPYFEIQLTPALNSDSDAGFAVPADAAYPESEANSTSANMRASTDAASNAHLRRATTVVRTHTGSNSHPSLSTHGGSHVDQDKENLHADVSTQTSAHESGVPDTAFVEATLTGMKTVHSGDQTLPESAPGAAQDASSAAVHTTSAEGGTESASASAAFPGSLPGSLPEVQAQHPPESLSFCRTVDLDRCLLDISDQGVVPLTPFTYLAIMRK